jgi:hypothetical protein
LRNLSNQRLLRNLSNRRRRRSSLALGPNTDNLTQAKVAAVMTTGNSKLQGRVVVVVVVIVLARGKNQKLAADRGQTM